MTLAATLPTNTTSTHMPTLSSNASSTRHPQGNPVFTQEDFLRFAQFAFASARAQQHHSCPSHSSSTGMQSQTQPLHDVRIMKPRLHLYESYDSPHSMIATLELPGLQRSDVSITARPNGELIISGQRQPQHIQYQQSLQTSYKQAEEEHEERGRTVFNELKFGKFQRVIRLPSGIDPTSISASMDDGMLSICWPLPEPRASHTRSSTEGQDMSIDDTESRRPQSA